MRKVHGANNLVARHMRLVLCKHCSAETECQTSGPSPCPLCCSCAACEPTHAEVDKEACQNDFGTPLSECNDDSKGKPTPAVPWLKMGGSESSHCASQDSLNDASNNVEDDKAIRKSFSGKDTRGRPKKVRLVGWQAAVPTSKHSFAHWRKCSRSLR